MSLHLATNLAFSISDRKLQASSASRASGRLLRPILELIEKESGHSFSKDSAELGGILATLKNIQCESSPYLLGQDLINLARNYLDSVTFQALALKTLETLKDSSLPQSAEAAALLSSFQGTGGSVGTQVSQQLRRITQSETLIPMSLALTTGGLFGQAVRAGLSSALKGSALAKIGGGAALQAVSSAGALIGNASVFPLGLGVGNSLLGLSSGLGTWEEYSESFVHGLSLMGTLGVAARLGQVLRWGLHGSSVGLNLARGAGEALRFRSWVGFSQWSVPVSFELGGLSMLNAFQEPGKQAPYYLVRALGMFLECRTAGALTRSVAPGLHHLEQQLAFKAYEGIKHSLTQSFANLKSRMASSSARFPYGKQWATVSVPSKVGQGYGPHGKAIKSTREEVPLNSYVRVYKPEESEGIRVVDNLEEFRGAIGDSQVRELRLDLDPRFKELAEEISLLDTFKRGRRFADVNAVLDAYQREVIEPLVGQTLQPAFWYPGYPSYGPPPVSREFLPFQALRRDLWETEEPFRYYPWDRPLKAFPGKHFFDLARITQILAMKEFAAQAKEKGHTEIPGLDHPLWTRLEGMRDLLSGIPALSGREMVYRRTAESVQFHYSYFCGSEDHPSTTVYATLRVDKKGELKVYLFRDKNVKAWGMRPPLVLLGGGVLSWNRIQIEPGRDEEGRSPLPEDLLVPKDPFPEDPYQSFEVLATGPRKVFKEAKVEIRWPSRLIDSLSPQIATLLPIHQIDVPIPGPFWAPPQPDLNNLEQARAAFARAWAEHAGKEYRNNHEHFPDEVAETLLAFEQYMEALGMDVEEVQRAFYVGPRDKARETEIRKTWDKAATQLEGDMPFLFGFRRMVEHSSDWKWILEGYTAHFRRLHLGS